MQRGKEIIQGLANELITCGGVLWTRGGLYKEMKQARYDPACIDYFAWGLPGASQKEIEGAVNSVPNQYPEGFGFSKGE